MTKRATSRPSPAPLLMAAVLAVVMAAAGCAPAISDGVLKDANRELDYGELAAEPGRHTGETVVFGGTVVDVENDEGLTRVYVLQQTLGRSLRPRESGKSGGRFIAEYKGFADPAVYWKGRAITVAGVVTEPRRGSVGKMPYLYPVIEVVEDHLWRSGHSGPRVGVGLGVIFGN